MFTYGIDSFYQMRTLSSQKKDAESIKANVEKIVSLANEVFNQYQGFESEQVKTLMGILPNSPQIPELLVIIPGLARSAGVTLDQFNVIEDISKSQAGQNQQVIVGDFGETGLPSQITGQTKVELGTVKISLSVSGTYDQIKNLISELEKETRIVDVETFNFSATDKGMVASLQATAYYLK